MWNYLLIPFAWHSAILLTQDGIQNGCQIILCLTLCFSRSIKWLLKQMIFHNNLLSKGHKNIMIPKVTHTVGSKHILSYINIMTPFEIKYHLRAILWKIIHILDIYLLCDCAEQHKWWMFNSVVSDCVYVFKRVSKMANRWLHTTIFQHFKCIIIKMCIFLDLKMTYWHSRFFWDAYIFYVHNMSINKTTFWE